eukprot:540524-Amorphochlora_amoeboformis.AAC.2
MECRFGTRFLRDAGKGEERVAEAIFVAALIAAALIGAALIAAELIAAALIAAALIAAALIAAALIVRIHHFIAARHISFKSHAHGIPSLKTSTNG